MQNNTDTKSAVELSVEEVVAAYRAADVKGKAALRTELTKSGQQAIRDLDMEVAVAAQARLDAIKAAPSKEQTEIDWTSVLTERLAVLMAAVEQFEEISLPEGVEVDFDLIREQAAEVEVEAEQVANLLTTPKTGSKSAKGDVGAWLAAAVGDEFKTVAQLRNSGTEVPEYPAGTPGAGAVSAALNAVLAGKREIEGVEVTTDSQGRLGAIAAS